jgi:para-nitrobenzyl esterase
MLAPVLTTKMNTIDRRKFLGSVTILSAAFAIPDYVYSSVIKAEEYVTVEITKGKIRGIRTEGVNIFKGVPYAGNVSGDRRFKRPAPLEPWTGVRDALQLGAPAIQPPRRNEPEPAEDCLFLNVWTPANDGKKRPVMFYSHGGGYVIGSGGSRGQDGANLARHFDVVVVETNHRLGLFGFLYLGEVAGTAYAESGNMGMLDITAGLKWVKENISVFGGDPDNVMIFGESGGGGKTSCLYAMPEAAPYFNKASIESGPGVRMTVKENAIKTTAFVLKELNIESKDWRKLLEIPATDLFNVQQKLPSVPPHIAKNDGEIGFGPMVDGIVLPNHPFDPTAPEISRDKPLMVGWNEDEFTFFLWQSHDTSFAKLDFESLQTKLEPDFGVNTKRIIETYRKSRPDVSAPDIFIAISSINMMGLGSIDIAEKKSMQHGAPAYLYNFGYKSEVKLQGTDYTLGTPHAMDISFKFNNEQPGGAPSFFGGSRPERFTASHNMAEFWTTFARTGKPAAINAPDWPAYNLSDRPTMRIDTKCEVIDNRFKDEIDMWRSIGMI